MAKSAAAKSQTNKGKGSLKTKSNPSTKKAKAMPVKTVESDCEDESDSSDGESIGEILGIGPDNSGSSEADSDDDDAIDGMESENDVAESNGSKARKEMIQKLAQEMQAEEDLKREQKDDISDDDADSQGEEELEGECDSSEEQQNKSFYDADGLKVKLTNLSQANKYHWIERLDYTTQEPVVVADIDDDTQRELAFYNQALESVLYYKKEFENVGLQFTRPDDYFAEMVKSDQHMQRVRKNLIADRESILASQQAKKQRELKKHAKMVQAEVLEQRAVQKKKNIEAVKKIRQQRKQNSDLNDEFDISVIENNKREFVSGKHSKDDGDRKFPSAKRSKKNLKYGFGGQKRSMKKNTAESSSDASAFSLSKNRAPMPGMKNVKGKGGKGSKTGGNGRTTRPGKNRRAKMRN